jgi:hypothetical protein
MNSVNAGRQTVITAEASTCGRFVATVLLHIVLFGIRKRNYALRLSVIENIAKISAVS